MIRFKWCRYTVARASKSHCWGPSHLVASNNSPLYEDGNLTCTLTTILFNPNFFLKFCFAGMVGVRPQSGVLKFAPTALVPVPAETFNSEYPNFHISPFLPSSQLSCSSKTRCLPQDVPHFMSPHQKPPSQLSHPSSTQ